MSVPEIVATDVLTALNEGINFVSDEETDSKRRKKHNKKRR